jgi:ribonuclease PH
VTGGFIALAAAAHARGIQRFLRDQVAAVSVGFVGDEVLVDLDYREDSAARVDMNVVASARGELVEVQATAEGRPIARTRFDAMLAGALEGIASLCALQRGALSGAGVDLDALLAPPAERAEDGAVTPAG